MSKQFLRLATGAFVLGWAITTQAALVQISYSDTSGNIGTGLIEASPNVDGSYTATSGSFQLTAGTFAGANAALVPNPNAPGTWNQRLYGGTDFIGLDDKVFPNQSPLVDVYGLLFNDVTFPRPGGQGLAFNLYYTGGSYHLAFNGYDNQPWYSDYGGGTMTLSIVPVPEVSPIFAGALLLLPLGASTIRRLRRNRAA